MDKVPRPDMLMVVGDLNAKVGKQQVGEEGIVGMFGTMTERNDNGGRFVAFCGMNNLAIASTMFPHKVIYIDTLALHQLANNVTRSIMWP